MQSQGAMLYDYMDYLGAECTPSFLQKIGDAWIISLVMLVTLVDRVFIHLFIYLNGT